MRPVSKSVVDSICVPTQVTTASSACTHISAQIGEAATDARVFTRHAGDMLLPRARRITRAAPLMMDSFTTMAMLQ